MNFGIAYEYWASVSNLPDPDHFYTLDQHQDNLFQTVSNAATLSQRANEFFAARGGVDAYIASIQNYPPAWASVVKAQIDLAFNTPVPTTGLFTADFTDTF